MAGKKLGGIKEGKSPFSLGLFLPVKPYMQKTECAGSRRVGITPEQPSASLWVCLEGLQPDRGKKTATKKRKRKTRELLSLVLKCLLVFLTLSLSRLLASFSNW